MKQRSYRGPNVPVPNPERAEPRRSPLPDRVVQMVVKVGARGQLFRHCEQVIRTGGVIEIQKTSHCSSPWRVLMYPIGFFVPFV